MGYLAKICGYAVEGMELENEIYTSERLFESCKNIIRPSMNDEEIRSSVIQIALELTTDSEPKWQYVASKLYIDKLYDDIRKNRFLPKLAIDISEHAYFLDYRFEKDKYIRSAISNLNISLLDNYQNK